MKEGSFAGAQEEEEKVWNSREIKSEVEIFCVQDKGNEQMMQCAEDSNADSIKGYNRFLKKEHLIPLVA